ncbi:hypothetical protein JCM5353_008893 [Sporobolomyces roseus]
MLPTEILEIVFSQVHLKTAAPTLESQAIFSSLCLTSKHFLHLAREYLYYRPILTQNATWKKLLRLLVTVSANPGRHAELVRSLEGLVESFTLIHGLTQKEIDQFRAAGFPLPPTRRAFAYLVKIVEACSKLHTANLTFESTEELAMALEAIRGSFSTLRAVQFGGGEMTPENAARLPFTLVESALQNPLLRRVDTVKIVELTGSGAAPYLVSPSINLPLRVLHLQQNFYSFDIMKGFFRKGFFLKDPSSLVDFSIHCRPRNDAAALPYIFDLLPTTLQRLRIAEFVHPDYRPTLKEYRDNHYSKQIPLEAFHPFSHLRHLTLTGFQAPSLPLLDALAISSPQLVTLDFSQSIWITGGGTSFTDYQALAAAVFPEREILQILTRFKHLRFIDFGWLPTTRSEDYPNLIPSLKALDSIGIKMILPTEVLDLVFSFVRCKSSAPTRQSQRNLAALALTSRNFLPLAREYLYYRPLVLKRQSWKKGLKLIDSLTMNGRLLGKMVRSLKGLLSWINVLRQFDPDFPLPYQSRGCTAAFSWYLQILRLCPRLQEAVLYFTTELELGKVLASIDSASSTLRHVGFKTLSRSELRQPSIVTYLDLVQKALEGKQLRSVETLYLGSIHVNYSVPVLPLIAPLLTCLIIKETSRQANMLQLLPHDLSQLLVLRLTFRTHLVDLNPILSRIEDTIKDISIIRPSVSAIPFAIDDYPFPPLTPAIPIDHFLRFAHLRSLKLSGFIGPSLALIQRLSSSCQQLTSLDFSDSFWISHNSSIPQPPSPQYFKAVFPEDLIIKELRELRHLKTLNLGTLPTTDEDDCERLEREMETRGIGFEWERCWMEPYYCDECDSYHEMTSAIW